MSSKARAVLAAAFTMSALLLFSGCSEDKTKEETTTAAQAVNDTATRFCQAKKGKVVEAKAAYLQATHTYAEAYYSLGAMTQAEKMSPETVVSTSSTLCKRTGRAVAAVDKVMETLRQEAEEMEGQEAEEGS